MFIDAIGVFLFHLMHETRSTFKPPLKYISSHKQTHTANNQEASLRHYFAIFNEEFGLIQKHIIFITWRG